MHVNDDTLRALLDGELDSTQAEEIHAHIQSCAECSSRMAAVQERMQTVRAAFSTMESAAAQKPLSSRAALSLFASRKKEKFPMSIFNIKRPVWAALVAVLALVIAFTFPPVQALARDFLALFRVEKVETMTLDTLNVEELSRNQNLFDALSQLFAESTTVTYGDPDAYIEVSGEAQAEEILNFDVRMPGAAFAPDQMRANTGFAAEIIIDRQRAQQVLDQISTSEVVLPESIDGAEIELSSAGVLRMKYGTCPEEDEEQPDWEKECMIFSQAPSPVVSTPPDLNLQELIETGLLTLGVSPEEAAAFSQSSDWTTTLTIPLPTGKMQHREIEVDGVTGSMFEHPSYGDPDEPRGYTLVWVKNGIVYTIAGANTEAKAIELANSLAQ
ncbi:MAG: hypothetical protein GYA48_10910 [Chloroflexi bacterium]|nr:hypothetical protein [Chloroflexota bacterium]